jgi:hypothetical protein
VIKKKHKKVWVELHGGDIELDMQTETARSIYHGEFTTGHTRTLTLRDDVNVIYREEDTDALKKLKEVQQAIGETDYSSGKGKHFHLYGWDFETASEKVLCEILDVLGID